MITEELGEAGLADIESWANQIIRSVDTNIEAKDSYHDPESNTYVIRLVRGNRVLLFRLSEVQVRAPEREAECEKTLRRRVKELQGLLR